MTSIKPLALGTMATVLYCGSFAALAGDAGKGVLHKTVIALKTAEFELQETDVSHLAVGESRTLVTDSGKSIDLLRTENGLEIYVDGELLETGGHDPAAHETLHQRVEITCTAEDDCDQQVWIETGEPGEGEGMTVERTIELHCLDADQCEHEMVWVGINDAETVGLDAPAGDADVIVLHEGEENPQEAGEKKVIIIKRKVDQP